MSTITRERIEQLANGNNICKVTREERIELEKLAPLLREEMAAMEAEAAAIKHALETAQSVADGLMNKSA